MIQVIIQVSEEMGIEFQGEEGEEEERKKKKYTE